MLDRKIFFWERAFTGQVLRLGVPTVIQSLLASILYIIGNVMVSRLGDAVVAGISQANRITFLFQLTMFGAVGGAGVFAAQYWSTKDVKNIRSVMGVGIIVAILVAALFAIPALIFAHPIMRVLTMNEEAQQVGVVYLRIVCITYFIQAISLLFASVLRSTEKVLLPMYAGIAAIVVSTGLNYLLIGGEFGLPALGVRGAAIATVAGAAVEFALLIAASYKKRYAAAIRPRDFQVPSKAFVKKYFAVVLPIIVNEGLWALGITMYSIAYGRMGDGKTILAGLGIFGYVEQLAGVLLRGVTHAAAVMIGIAVGSGDRDLSDLYAKRFLFGSFVVGIFAGAFALIVRDPILSVYTEMSDETISVARYIITIYGLSLWMKSMCSQLIVGMLRPGGDVMYSMYVDVGPLWVVGIPLIFLLGVALRLPIELVYPVTLIEEAAKALMCLFRMRSKKWINNLTEAEVEEGLPCSLT